MSKVLEYLKLIPTMVKNREKIVEGIVNNLKLQNSNLEPEIEDEIIRRRIICEGCPFMSENAKNNPNLNYKSDRTDKHCTICLCDINFKTASLESNCGIEIHNINNPDSPMALKWQRFTQTNKTNYDPENT